MTSTLPAGSALDPRDVAVTAREYWRVAGQRAEILDWNAVATTLGWDSGMVIGAAVVVPKMMRIECVFDANARFVEAWSDLAALVAEGWRVQALLPLSSLGAAHEALRGLDILLQGWWTTQERELRFTSPETP